jgi:pyridoxine/pyridoxamine 5'-phosphate oxidase
MERLQKESVMAGLLIGTFTFLALCGAKSLWARQALKPKTGGMRNPPTYHTPSALDFENPPKEPIEAFKIWFSAAQDVTTVPNPNAMAVATIDASGQPSVRMVLCRGYDSNGVVFYTNREGRKGQALEANPRACANFHWD